MTSLWSAVSGFPFSVTLPIPAQISSAAAACSVGRGGASGSPPCSQTETQEGQAGDVRVGLRYLEIYIPTGPQNLPPLLWAPLPPLPPYTSSFITLLFRTTQDSLGSPGKCVCVCVCVCVIVPGEGRPDVISASRASHRVCSSDWLILL